MRSRLLPLAMLAVAACSDSTAPRRPDDPEVPRGEWAILVETLSRAGERSFFSMSPDGSYVAPLTGLPGDAVRVIPSPDGSTLAWIRETEEEEFQLWTMDRDGGNRRSIIADERTVHDVAWSPDGTRLAVELSTHDDVNDIWIFEADGGGGTQITFDLPNAALFDHAPTWSPDGSKIAIASNRSGSTRLWTMNANGSGLTQVMPDLVGTEWMPAWSPDGSLIAFRSGTTGPAGIGIVRPDGTGFREFPFSRQVGSISWTPDGLILFTGVVELDYEVHTMHPVTGAITRLTTHPSHDWRANVVRRVEPAAWSGFAVGPRYVLGRANPPGVEVGDLDADGNLDMLVLAPAWEEIRILLGAGDGTFEPLGALTAPADQRAVAVADVSRDAIDDVIVLGASGLHVWRGSDQGPGVATMHPFNGDGRGLAVSDFDVDGSADVVAIHERPAGFALLVHSTRSDGELVAVVDHQTSFSNAGRACAGDITGDGWDDLVIATGSSASPVVLMVGRKDGTFADGVVATTAVTANAEASPVCADFNGDRRSDLALLTPGSTPRLTILRAKGNGFGSPSTIDVAATAIVAGDVDRDGDVDLMVTREPGGIVQFIRNRGDGVFAAPVNVGVGGLPLRLVLGDVDRDGWLDLGIGDRDGSVALLRNRGR